MMASAQGLTLLEVLVALGIMALGISAAVGFMPRRPAAVEVEATARQIAAALRDARSTAIASNRPVGLHVDTARGQYGTKATPLQLELFTTADQRVADAAGSIRFYPDGGSSGGGVVVRDGGRRFIVLVDWLSGNVSVVRDATSH